MCTNTNLFSHRHIYVCVCVRVSIIDIRVYVSKYKITSFDRHIFIFISSANLINNPSVQLTLSTLICQYLQLEYRQADFGFHTNSVTRKHKIVHNLRFLLHKYKNIYNY